MIQQPRLRTVRLLVTCSLLSVTLYSLSAFLTPRLVLAEEAQIEFLHWWNSIGERQSGQVLSRYLSQHNLQWNDRGPSYGSTAEYLANIAQQLSETQRPDAAMMVSSDIKNYNAEFSLLPLDAIAQEQEWEEVVPHAIQETAQQHGRWISAPINSHSTNWLWVNKKLFTRLNLAEPETWDDLIAVLDAAQALGMPALAALNDNWEQAMLFELVVMSTGGLEFYRRFFIEKQFNDDDIDILTNAFLRLHQLTQYFTATTTAVKWHEYTALLNQDQLLMQVHGSWVNGELSTLGAEADVDFLCMRFPGTQGAYLFHSDHVIFFDEPTSTLEHQQQLARILLDKEFQRELSIASGASPARVDIDTKGFSSCSKKSIHSLRMANMRRAVMASLNSKELFKIVAHYLANPSNAQAAAEQVVNHFAKQPPTANSQ